MEETMTGGGGGGGRKGEWEQPRERDGEMGYFSFECALELVVEEGIKKRASIMARGMCHKSTSQVDPKHRCQNEPYKGCRTTSSIVVRR